MSASATQCGHKYAEKITETSISMQLMYLKVTHPFMYQPAVHMHCVTIITAILHVGLS